MALDNHACQAQYLFVKGRVVAELTTTGILDRRTWQILRKPEPSIGYDISLLEDAKSQGATIARNRDDSHGHAYVAPISRISELGTPRDLGWGRQIFLPLRYWDVVHADGTTIPAKLPNMNSHFAQLSLFGNLEG